MYVPPAFKEDDPAALRAMIAQSRLSHLVTATAMGLISTPLPLFLVPGEGEHGTLYGHVAKANPQWKTSPIGEALAIFMGPDAYVSPSWYASKREHGKVVPTWNYTAVHACGPAEFFEDADRLREVVSRLTNLHEQPRQQPWAVTDAPEAYVHSQLKGIVGIRLPVTRIEGKCKLSQNRTLEDRKGVIEGLSSSERESDRCVAGLVSRAQFK